MAMDDFDRMWEKEKELAEVKASLELANYRLKEVYNLCVIDPDWLSQSQDPVRLEKFLRIIRETAVPVV